MENISRKKNNLLISFIEAIKEIAVDCELFKSHNMMGSKYKCFKFEEESLFEDPVGPAYKDNMEFDEKMDNGLNSIDSKTMRIKVRKIRAVRKLDEKNYSKVLEFWYYDKTNVIYDLELNYPIGKIEIDENNIPIKINKDTYLIGKSIDIPQFKLFN